MTAWGPIIRAVVMDLVTSEVRGRWNSLQFISMFTWSGSAALGGYLADYARDYRFTFVVTAWIYTFSGLLCLVFLLVFPREQQAAELPVPLPGGGGAA